jgi:hypothetical protein
MSVPLEELGAVPLQTLVRLVKEEDGGVFGPEDIAVMATAFDRLLADYKLVDRNDPIVTMLAKLVIEIVRNGERDPERIRQEVLGARRFAPPARKTNE